MSAIDQLLDSIPIPRMVRVKQAFERPIIDNVELDLLAKLKGKNSKLLISPGQSVAVAIGSRGISALPEMVKTLIQFIRDQDGIPFIVPAMGSHGGATAEGQKEMLRGLGVTEEYVGAPIRATMETLRIGVAENGLPVFIDKYAYEADAIVIINRIKPHIAFRGEYESGLMKMITIGLGKQKGADICHELGFGRMTENIPAIARVILEKTNLVFGVAVLENAYHELCQIEVLKNGEIEAGEPALLKEAKRLSPKLYFDSLDVLVIDEIGKNISGTGFDNNVVGRYHTPYASGGPTISKIAALDITDVSHGNGNGLGILDFTTRRAFNKFSFEHTYPNALTSTVPLSVKIPMVLKNDKQAIQAAIKTCNILDKTKVRMVRVKNTLCLGEIEVSENLIEEVKQNPNLEIVSSAFDLALSEQGSLFE
ncbi:lactate racemase domain-containing protein [Desulfosporosinus shakirovi]|uniref:lactate racemase domain-containing protein n=1 Tax=Desulfosporosinus shakirovi TaxID=2885154 RepID=UPI001E5CF4B4|nr:lactate racemase domain-containing protein [Desulfosporosinus sp. SRJS8]MCB8815158.1 nickel-dependent lactate racemase [Desulfosporosinus sp. SRJS8]